MFEIFTEKLHARAEEKRIYRAMKSQALAIVQETYKKDRVVRKLQSENLTSSLLQECVQRASYDLKLTLKLKDGTELIFERQDVVKELNRLDDRFGT